MGFIYFIVIVLANTVGAISGMGGGVIIKPVFDFLGYHSVSAISFYSAVAVFTMAVTSTIRQIIKGNKIDLGTLAWLSFGSVIGGIGGNVTFEKLLSFFSEDRYVQLVQIVLTIFSLLFAFFYARSPWTSYHFTSGWSYLLCGLGLGFLASLLGIGGGPINVAFLMLLFSIKMKEATIYSIGTILFSQLAKLTSIFLGTGVAMYDLSMLYFIIPAAILGGTLGAYTSNILSEKKVSMVFQVITLFVLGINIYNGILLFI